MNMSGIQDIMRAQMAKLRQVIFIQECTSIPKEITVSPATLKQMKETLSYWDAVISRTGAMLLGYHIKIGGATWNIGPIILKTSYQAFLFTLLPSLIKILFESYVITVSKK